MNRPTAASDEAVLGALEGIVRMQRGIRSSDIDMCIETGLVFLRINYREPGKAAGTRRQTGERRRLCPGYPGGERVPGEDRLRPTRARWLAGRPGR